MSLIAFLDAVAPGVVFAQALGRWGNWFNNELYGDPTALPWKLQIHQMDAATGSAVTDPAGAPVVLGYFQPTFLYESLWCVVVGFFFCMWTGASLSGREACSPCMLPGTRRGASLLN
ncbi:prolipoprotein diacylglyceryl transferase (plasmid) [Arthrobacter sp. Hiyo8]|nr:prolipoprotein diacylglyceryl transferase [Arthrobacter sp. Hiyo8]